MNDLPNSSHSIFETPVVHRIARGARARTKPSTQTSTSALADPTLDLFGTTTILDDERAVNQITPQTLQEKADSRQLYPHLYDVEGQSAKALLQLRAAINDLTKAVEAFSDGDMNEVWSFLALAAAGLTKAYEASTFHKPFSMAVSYLQRAISSPNYASLELGDLFVMQRSLNALYENPTLHLSQVVQLTRELEKAGWTGESAEVAVLAAEILSHLGYSSDFSESPFVEETNAGIKNLG